MHFDPTQIATPLFIILVIAEMIFVRYTTRGDYEPLEVVGPHRDQVIAFARRRGRDAAIIVVTKTFAAMSQAAGPGPARMPSTRR